MGVNNFLNATCQTKKTRLDKLYYDHVNGLLSNIKEEDEIRWETYGLIIDNLIKLGYKNILKEVKYRITDGENPNKIMLDIIQRYSENVDSMVWFLKRRVEEYLEEDYFNEFF